MVRREYAQRIGRSVTQRDMARMIDVPAGNYAAWEAGNGIPTDLIGVTKRIAAITGADPLWLLGWFEDPDDPDGSTPSDPDDGGDGGAVATSTKWLTTATALARRAA